jgi:hypothetical protein
VETLHGSEIPKNQELDRDFDSIKIEQGLEGLLDGI